ncbi:uncharacterized protein METZ01_LOCUS169668, partial [marine metagenome]
TSASVAWSVYAADVDGDEDMDVLSASHGDQTIAWYENDGSGSFTTHEISTSVNGAISVYAADVDGDGDMDVLSAAFMNNTIAWYENDGSENFTEHVVSNSANGAHNVHAADVDGDGDMDVLSASENDHTIAWYENDNSPPPPSESSPFILYGTIEDLNIEAFDISGDRLYGIFPGTNSSGQGASLLTIIDLTSLELIATHGPLNGYPNRIDVFDQIVVVDGNQFFNVADDVIEYLGDNFIESAFNSSIMHTHRRGNFLYSALGSTGFGIYDMTDPLNPVTVFEHDYEVDDDYPYGISANDDYIFISDLRDNGDVIIHIHNNGGSFPPSYRMLGQINTNGNGVHRTASQGNYLYTTRNDDILVYDISDPENPEQASNRPGAECSNGEIKIVGGYLLIAGGGHASWSNPRAHVFDVSEYHNAVHNIGLVASFDDPLPSYDIDLVGGKLYVAFGSQGDESTWDGSLGGSIRVYSQNTYVPDNNFEQTLIDDGHDDTLDDYVLTANIIGVEILDVNEKEISDLTGIEDFTALTSLYCNNNQLTVLDVSSNTALTGLDCGYNQLTALDVSNNTALTELECHNNQLLHLNMKNGVTDQLTEFIATSNSLHCIEVNEEDVDWATENWTSANGNIDNGVIFSGLCSVPDFISAEPDDNPEDQEEISITVEISDENGIDGVTLHYRQGGSSGYTSVA